MNAYEIAKELGLKSIVCGRQNYVIAISTVLFRWATAATKSSAKSKGLTSCLLSDAIKGDYVTLYFTYKKDVLNAIEKLSSKIPTKWV